MYCPSCGERVDDEAKYCRHCGEEITPLHDDADIDQSPTAPAEEVVYYCQRCGERHIRNNPPCKSCGGMDLETVQITQQEVDDVGDEQPAVDGETSADADGVGSAPLSVYVHPVHRYYWLGLGLSAALLASGLLLVLLGRSLFVFGWLQALNWSLFVGVLICIYWDSRRVRRHTDWSPNRFLHHFGPLLPVLGYPLILHYFYARHRGTVEAPSGRVSYSGLLVGSITSAGVAIAVLPVVFGPLSMIAGFKIRSTWDQAQGTAIMTIGLTAMVIGGLIGISAVA